MRVSIITAAYNAGRSIASTLKSVALQEHPDIEHIIVNGASTDDTVKVIGANYARVACLISEADTGVYDAFNKGLRRATGEVIAFLNAGDTYISPRAVSTAIKGLVECGGAQAVFADVLIVDAEDQSVIVRRYSSKRFTPHSMIYGLAPAHPTLFMRRDVYDRVGEFDTNFRVAGDFELCLRVFVTGSVKYRYISEALVRMPRGGLSNSGWRSKWAITREMYAACRANGVEASWFKLCLRLPVKAWEML